MEARVKGEEAIPLGQRLFDSWFLLLVVGLAVVGVLYVGWGLYEIVSMPEATLP
jgi:cytochrome c-type biogenesis protein CcmH/NrfG